MTTFEDRIKTQASLVPRLLIKCGGGKESLYGIHCMRSMSHPLHSGGSSSTLGIFRLHNVILYTVSIFYCFIFVIKVV